MPLDKAIFQYYLMISTHWLVGFSWYEESDQLEPTWLE